MIPTRWAPSTDSSVPPPLRPWRIRPLTGADRPAVRQLFESLSAASRRLRFHAPVPRYPSAWWSVLGRVPDGSAEVALAWVGTEPIGHAMWTRVARRGVDHADVADVAVVVVEAWRRRGVARDLVMHAAHTAAAAGITRFTGPIHPENDPARDFARVLGARPGPGSLDWDVDLAVIAPGVGAPATTWRAAA